MKSLRISDDLSLPQDVVTQKLAVLGTSGSGKSYAAQKLAELMLDVGAQIIAVDPVGIWWSLRLLADGKHEGYSQVRVFGGDHGDLPLTRESGSLIGRLLAERRLSAVLDVSQFTTGEMKYFLTRFAEQFFQSKKSHKSPVHLFLEECQTYIPEHVTEKDDPLMVNRWERLIKFYRNYGGGVSMISQQPQSVSKKVLNLADTLFAMRTIGSHERGAILKWVKDVIETESDLVKNLPKLDTGVAHIWSPSWLKISRNIRILPKITFDAGKTPEMGVHLVEPKPLTPLDVEQLRAEMAEMIAEAEKDDPKALRKQINELQKQLRSKETAVVEKPVEKIVEIKIPVVDEQAVQDLKVAGDFLHTALGSMRSMVERMESILIDCQNSPRPQPTQKPVERRGVIRTHAEMYKQPHRPAQNNGDSKLRAGAERMLAALCQWYPESMSFGQMRSHAGMKKSGTFSTYLSDLRRGGYIEENGDTLKATEDGIAYFGGNIPEAPSTTDEVLAVWNPKLREGARRMLEVLVRHRGRGISHEELTAEAGLSKSGTYSTYLSDLRRARLIETDRGEVRANKETLFL